MGEKKGDEVFYSNINSYQFKKLTTTTKKKT